MFTLPAFLEISQGCLATNAQLHKFMGVQTWTCIGPLSSSIEAIDPFFSDLEILVFHLIFGGLSIVSVCQHFIVRFVF